MNLHNRKITALVLALASWPAAANAKQICGWYAIVYCSESRAGASAAADSGWGTVINTNHFRGFAPGNYCVVSGPQSKSSALADRKAALQQGVTQSAYVKRACADERYTGD